MPTYETARLRPDQVAPEGDVAIAALVETTDRTMALSYLPEEQRIAFISKKGGSRRTGFIPVAMIRSMMEEVDLFDQEKAKASRDE